MAVGGLKIDKEGMYQHGGMDFLLIIHMALLMLPRDRLLGGEIVEAMTTYPGFKP